MADVIEPGVLPAERARLAYYENKFKEARRMEREAEAALNAARADARKAISGQTAAASRIEHLEHIAAGKCAWLIRDGDRWHPSYAPCSKNAKGGERFCGTHRKSAERYANIPLVAGLPKWSGPVVWHAIGSVGDTMCGIKTGYTFETRDQAVKDGYVTALYDNHRERERVQAREMRDGDITCEECDRACLMEHLAG